MYFNINTIVKEKYNIKVQINMYLWTLGACRLFLYCSEIKCFSALSAIYNCQCWEGYFGNLIGYRLQVTVFKM